MAKSESVSTLFKDLMKKSEKQEKKYNNDYDSIITLLTKIQNEEANGRDIYQLEDNLEALKEVHAMGFEDYSIKVLEFQYRKKEHDNILLEYQNQFGQLKNQMNEQDTVFKKEQSELDELKKKMNELDNAKRVIEAVTMDINKQIIVVNNEKDNVETWVKGIEKKLTTLCNIEQALQNEVNNLTENKSS